MLVHCGWAARSRTWLITKKSQNHSLNPLLSHNRSREVEKKMTTTKLKDGVELKKSGTNNTIKITPRYWMFSCRVLENMNGEKGTHNKPHAHIKPSFLRKLFGG